MSLKSKLNEVRSKVKEVQEIYGLSHEVEIVGVTKTHPPSIIEESFLSGFRSIGENRVQEAESKFKLLKELPGLKKRFIGNLQSNKINKCVSLFDTIDSIDSKKKMLKISRAAEKINKKIIGLIEVNTSQEIQKGGFEVSQLDEIIECCFDKNVEIEGLMTIGPNTKNEKKVRQSFRTLRELREKINQRIDHRKLNHLSMGMSGDYKIAVAEGSTMIRIGSFFYGLRSL